MNKPGSHGALCMSESICVILRLTPGHMFKEAGRLILISQHMSAGQRLVSNCTLQQLKSLCVMVCWVRLGGVCAGLFHITNPWWDTCRTKHTFSVTSSFDFHVDPPYETQTSFWKCGFTSTSRATTRSRLGFFFFLEMSLHLDDARMQMLALVVIFSVCLHGFPPVVQSTLFKRTLMCIYT